MSFFNEFFDILDSTKEQAVLCPFEHTTESGIPYQETNPSAHINTMDKLFHCKACGKGYNEIQFIQKVCGCTYINARRIQVAFDKEEESVIDWDNDAQLSDITNQRALALGISNKIIQELKIKSQPEPTNPNVLLFPVFMYNRLMDIRAYNPGQKPKMMSRKDAIAGLIIPFDIWRETDIKIPTLICAGEKDMSIARTHNFNAITLTGGEHTLPICLEQFKNRPIVILYDNDDAGIAGARALAAELYKVTHTIKIVTAFHEVCCEKGEDLTDFYIKYEKTNADLMKYIKMTPLYTPTTLKEKEMAHEYPIVDLFKASKPEYINKLVQTNIQVVAVSEQTFITPTIAVLEKFRQAGKNDDIDVGTIREWHLEDKNLEDLLHLIDNNFTETMIKENLKELVKMPKKERCVSIKVQKVQTIFKAYVTDLFETNADDIQPMEYVCYSLKHKLESGKKYLVTHKLVPHPYKGQQLIMLITDVKQANDSITSFNVNPETIKHLKEFQDIPEHYKNTARLKVNYIAKKVKGLLGYNGNDQLIQTIDLAYHTVLKFNFGTFKDVRGYLDTLIVGESRVGKSSTAEALQKTYGLGTFISLAGNSATIPGLVGGSNKLATGYQTRAGVIPQNHKGLVIFEEFGKCSNNIVAELTDIRSSNEVRIARISGTITLPALVRMIALTNVKATEKSIKSIAAYPDGISIITELVPTAEDIARYDIMLVLADRGSRKIDPTWQPDKPYSIEAYRTRIRWVWSRTVDQIKISRPTEIEIINISNELNEKYDSHIKIFGTETWKKLTRLAIAIAGYTVSTDKDYEDIIVLPSHVKAAADILIELYDNPTFRYAEYVKRERQYSQTNAEATAMLQDIFQKSPALVQGLEQYASVTKNMLSATSGLDTPDLNLQLNKLTKGLFIKIDNFEIQPTERFRRTVVNINKNTHVRMLGEVDDA